jgi:competence protein ComEA
MSSLTPRQVAMYAVAALLVLAVGWRYATPPPSQPAAPAPGPAPVAAEPDMPAVVVVDVAGAVRRPGVHRLPGGARVQDAVRKARPRPGADLAALNLAARLADGEKIVVPRRGETVAAAAGGSAGAAPAAGGIVHLNSATAEQLEALDGIGPSLAAAIVEYRETNGGFSSVEELDQVSGIGPARLAALAGQVAP